MLQKTQNLDIRRSQGGPLMKNRLAVLFTLASCLISAALSKPAWAMDPGSRYSDAFVLIQQGQAAEDKADLVTAYQRYHGALDILRAIRTEVPDWNGQMVEYRLKDTESHFEAIKAKLPNLPPVPAVETSAIATPAVIVAANEVTTPAITATPPPAAPSLTTPVDDQSAKLRAQIDKLASENQHLTSDLAEAKSAAKSSVQADKLGHENKELKDQLAAAQKKDAARADALEKQNKDLGTQLAAAEKKASTPSAAPSESAELKKLRAELTDAQNQAESGKKAATLVTNLEKQNKDLSAQLADAKKETSTKVVAVAPAPASDSSALKKLRAEADSARADADKARKTASDLEKKNSDLSSQITAAKKQATDTANAKSAESTELKKVRADLDAARADAAQAQKSTARVAGLEKENKDLSAKLDAATKTVSAQPTDSAVVKSLRTELDKSHTEVVDLKKQVAAKPTGDSTEVKNLRTQLTDAQRELDQARKSASQVSNLEKQNKDLSAQLADAKQQASAKASNATDAAELNRLNSEANSARVETDKARKVAVEFQKKNADLLAKLAAEKKAEAVVTAAEPADSRIMRQLRNENSYFRNLLDTYAANNTELKGQLHRHDLNEAKNNP
jgi:predicted  nucleic acid-binding Zn-ribbon protein